MPERKPEWKHTFPFDWHPLGFGMQEKVFVSAKRDNEGNTLGIIVIDMETGVVQQVELPADEVQGKKRVYRQDRLYDDKHSVFLIPDYQSSNQNELLVFDWLNKKVTDRYEPTDEHGSLNHPIALKNKIFATGGRSNHLNLLVWDKHDPKPKAAFRVASAYDNYHYGLTDDGELAHFIITHTGSTQLLIVDVAKQTIIQTIPGRFEEISWAIDKNSFRSVELDTADNLCSRTYVAGKSGYERVEGSLISYGFKSDAPLQDKPYFIFSYSPTLHPIRMKLSNLLGTSGQHLLNRVWPIGQVIQMHDKSTGKLAHRFVDADKDAWVKWPFPNRQASYLVLSNGKTKECWQIRPLSQWYPLWGFVSGLQLSVLLTWRLIRARKGNSTIATSAIPSGSTSIYCPSDK